MRTWNTLAIFSFTWDYSEIFEKISEHRVIRFNKSRQRNNGWKVNELRSYEPSDVWSKMCAADIAAVTKQEEYDKIRRVIRLFGAKGATLPEVGGTFQVIYGHEMKQSLLRELLVL